jgi:CBS domain-containing protein
MDVELSEIRDFLAAHAPFDVLPRDVLADVPRQCTLRYARRGSVVLDVGERGTALHVVRSGAVDVLDESGALVERVAAGGAFGMSALLEHRPTRYRFAASEDTLLLLLPADLFESLTRDHPGFLLFYAATHHDRMARAIANLQQASSGATVLSTPVRELVSRPPVTTSPEASVAEAARTMSAARVSSLLVTDGVVQGILTDRDLRNRVLAAGLDTATPVREVMTSPAQTLPADALAFEALLEMVSRRIHHLPLVDGRGAPVGVVTTTDLVRLESSDPVHLAADVARQATLAGVVQLARGIPQVLARLVDRDVSAADIGRIVTALGDAVRRRVVALVEAELGPPPTPYAWVVLGSAAREEEALAGDQDHALVVSEPGHDAWFAELAARVTDVLADSGWPRCPGGVMATNPRWRGTVADWHAHFADWSREPRPDAVLEVAIFYDMRHLAGDVRLTEAVRRHAAANVSARLLGHLAGQATAMRPPLGFFRSFVLEHEGEHRDTLDIKRGLGAVVQLARVYALRAGVDAVPTRARLEAAAGAGVVDPGTAQDLRDAFELMSYRRLHHQVEQLRAGDPPDNGLDPSRLTDRQRRHLKDAFAIVRAAQQRMSSLLQPGYT